MAFTGSWINSYGSLMTLQQDPVSGMLTGTYASTTGGTGTYDLVGWAGLGSATPAAGQTISISILWRSNDGGKSDPSHEVSAMAGQLVVNADESLELIHVFVETNPTVPPPGLGVYPDKLIFTPTKAAKATLPTIQAEAFNGPDHLSGVWIGELAGEPVEMTISRPDPTVAGIGGSIYFADGTQLSLIGFTDIYAEAAGLPWQGLSFCTHKDVGAIRYCQGLAGYLDFSSHLLHLTRLTAQQTAAGSTWYQADLTNALFTSRMAPGG